MDLNLTEANKFISYHAQPNQLSESDLAVIEDLILKYPYCQSLHFLALKASENTASYQLNLEKAAAFAPSRDILYEFVHHTDAFKTTPIVLDESVLHQDVSEETAEETNDFGQAFSVDLNKLAVNDTTEEVTEVEVVEDVHVEEPETETEEISEEVETIEAVEEPIEAESPVEELAEIETIDSLDVSEPELEEAETEEITEEVEIVEESEEQVEAENPVEEVAEIETINGLDVSEPELEEAEIEEQSEDSETIQTEEKPVDVENPIEEIAEVETIDALDFEVPEIEEAEVEQTSEEVETIEAEENPVDVESPVEEIAEVETIDALDFEVPETEEAEVEQTLEEVDTIEAEEESVEAETPVEEVAEIETIDSLEVAEPEPEEEELNLEKASLDETESVSETEENKQPLEQEFIFESPVSTDFFAFAKKEKGSDKEELSPSSSESDKKENITPYNDESMPYTFLWWLNKTRKEHADNTQPYTQPNTTEIKVEAQKPVDDLNNQIAENIFQIRSADDIAATPPKNMSVPFDYRKKEFQIIEKFIKEEPQIKPQANNKIDTENKAKRSSEDANDVVSETLAKIYVEQMLYHKALDVYKKLSLKYPEKSTYFASQIKYLELKVN